MKNITLAVDEAVLAKVRRYAADRDTTVNALVRQYLAMLAERDDRAKTARDRLLELAEKSDAVVGPITWTRDDLYER